MHHWISGRVRRSWPNCESRNANLGGVLCFFNVKNVCCHPVAIYAGSPGGMSGMRRRGALACVFSAHPATNRRNAMRRAEANAKWSAPHFEIRKYQKSRLESERSYICKSKLIRLLGHYEVLGSLIGPFRALQSPEGLTRQWISLYGPEEPDRVLKGLTQEPDKDLEGVVNPLEAV